MSKTKTPKPVRSSERVRTPDGRVIQETVPPRECAACWAIAAMDYLVMADMTFIIVKIVMGSGVLLKT